MKTVRMICLVQLLQYDPERASAVTRAIQEAYRRHIGIDYQIEPVWVLIPLTQSFLAKAPATGSWLQISVPDQTSMACRHRFMEDARDAWALGMNADGRDLALSTPSETLHARSINMMFPAGYRGMLKRLNIGLQLAKAKFLCGHKIININAIF